eukprot:TRINITY_DN243_c0_g1_i13.p2 TRINITY_DN243_c0_g1~~TRINITY_DN243_c0_g1_i13.p2  ORF type:complete len:450 (+),score=147.42 TRINITY_DN243_c0_g1_i13:87-1352(+)
MADACELRLEESVEEAIAGRIQAAPGQEHAEHLECAVCWDTALECPVKAVPCGHYFHEGCLRRWLNGKVGEAHSCPHCRKQLPAGDGAYTKVDYQVKAILDGTRVPCPQKCGEPQSKRMRFDGLAKHIRKECPLTPLVCTGADCGKVLPRKEMEGAHLTECEHVLVPCGQCEEKVKRAVLQGHKAGSCPRRPITCAHCKKQNLLYCDREKHELQCTGSVPMRVVAELRQAMAEQQSKQAEHSAKLAAVERRLVQTGTRVLETLARPEKASSHRGLMFDLESKGQPVAVTALWIAHQTQQCDWEIWGRAAEGSYRDQQGPEGWEKLSSGNYDGAEHQLHRCPLSRPVPVPPGGRRAFYIYSSHSRGVVFKWTRDADYAPAEDGAVAVRPGTSGISRTRFWLNQEAHGLRDFVGCIEYTFLPQ